MIKIKVNGLLQSAFSNEQAELLKSEINNYIDKEDKIILDFSGITKFTTLFFNFSTGYFVNLLGKDKYDEMFEIDNLNELGESTYIHSYNNSVKNDADADDDIKEKILSIINNTEEA